MLIWECSGSIKGRLSSMDPFHFFFEPLQFHSQLADLLIQTGCQRFLCFLLPTLPTGKHLWKLIQELLLPLGDLRGMHAILCCQLIGCLLSLDCLQGYLGLGLRTMSLSLCLHRSLS